jgi:predicted amidophosphoribosyltransferase
MTNCLYSRARSTTHSALRDCLSILLPTACLVCERPLRGGYLCFRCVPSTPDLSQIRRTRCVTCFEPLGNAASARTFVCATCLTLPLNTDSQRFLWEYRGLARDYIKAMKYRPSKKLARLAGDLLAHAIPFVFEEYEWDLVIPIPSSAKMFRKRCFHPCVEMGHQVARTLNVPLRQLLTTNAKRAPQASLHHNARLKGMEKLFAVRTNKDALGKRVLLIEDVITTGATIAAATQCLRGAGAERVDVLALGRTQVWQRFRHRVSVITSSYDALPGHD